MVATIKDVAKRAGLSQATVSRALNKSGYVSQETLARVEQAAAELGYQPNWMARGLHGKSSNLIGLLVPEVMSLYDNSVIQYMTEKLHAHNYGLMLCIHNERADLDLKYLQLLHEKRVAGIIYTHPLNGDNSELVHQLAEHLPIIELNRRREAGLLDAVLADNIQGARQITRYLLGLGHRRIALIMGEDELTTGQNRLHGYQLALTEAGLPADRRLIRIGSFSRQHGEAAMHDLLDEDVAPTAILAGSNRILMGVLKTLTARNIHIPVDLSVAAFNDTEWLQIWNPPITTVDIAVEEMAHWAVDLLLKRISVPDVKPTPREYLLGTSLIIRESCRAV
ncbi:MAG: LacI family DNA-binding transcriptional regulator [Caldilineaceae bacterium]|nr:LacI family DNA-binding transcriptional regulator [Caldilineaceae bacterium]MCB9149369.1 LacI family DNA-binding transcriptional regulator [Caldilineaceae bacterium]